MYTSLISLLALAPMVPHVAARACAMPPSNGKAVYLISNNDDNAVLSFPVQRDGLLGKGTSTRTGGKGMAGISGMTNQPAGPDPLFSQQPLTVVGKSLFAVNPGSNTLSMFAIDEHDPTKLTLVHDPIALPGEFPVTVGASEKNKVVCVGFSGAKSGISCSKYSHEGVGKMDSLRSVGITQTTPPKGPGNTLSQVYFSDDGSTLYSNVKGDPMKNTTGFLASYSVRDGYVSEDGYKSSPSGTALLFGAEVIPGTDNIVVTDPTFGAAIVGVNHKGDATTIGRGAIKGQSASCWVTVNEYTNTAFVADGALDHLYEVSLTDASTISTVDLTPNGDPSLTDLVSGGKLLYALAGGNGSTVASVTVVDAVSKKQVQHVELQSLGGNQRVAGMAILQ